MIAGPTKTVPTEELALPPENMSGHSKKVRFFLEHLRDRIAQADRPLHLLDFGCGNGSAVSRFLMLDGVRYYGVDFHEPSRVYASEHFGGETALFLDRVPEGVTFDVLVYSDVLEHLDRPRELLKAHRDSLADDGILIGCVPNGYGPFENEKRLDRWLKISAILDLPARLRRNLGRTPARAPGTAVPYNAACGHVQFFTRKSLIHLLEDTGYRVGEFRNGAFVGAPLSERYLFRGGRIAAWNARVADRLPGWAVSTWLFTAHPGRVG